MDLFTRVEFQRHSLSSLNISPCLATLCTNLWYDLFMLRAVQYLCLYAGERFVLFNIDFDVIEQRNSESPLFQWNKYCNKSFLCPWYLLALFCLLSCDWYHCRNVNVNGRRHLYFWSLRSFKIKGTHCEKPFNILKHRSPD